MKQRCSLAVFLSLLLSMSGSVGYSDEQLQSATPVEDIRTAEGFRVELLYSVPGESFGSWVAMTPDPKGRLIVSDQYGRLYRVTVPPVGESGDVNVELIDIELGMAQGLLYAFDSLYVMVNGTDKEKQGLYRVTDSDGDDQFDKVEWLRQLQGGGEHGPHAIVLAPDGRSLYVCAGNHTNPTDFSSTRVPPNYEEDHLLPRMWDAGGHAVNKMAPGGWIAKVSPDGKDWELVASGFRNEYDIAFNTDGELFTYDADMEWDVGTPWYRPTRVNHVVSGAEFGWRSGTGKWPVWYPDSLGSVVDIGPGSPTGISFGTGAAFPERYQKALFLCDWSYGVIYAVHFEADGSTYRGTAERFVNAAPLPVTDIIVNPADGAMYFTIGGRRTQSGLYRVTADGSAEGVSATESEEVADAAALRAARRRLEALHRDDAADAVEKAWPYIGHEDRNIRFAARIALEHRPVEEWRGKALGVHSGADAAINSLLALTRNGDESDLVPVLEALGKLRADELSTEQSLAALRVLSLAFIRLGEPDGETATAVKAVLDPMYPSDDDRLNRELCALLVYLGSDEVAEETLGLMAGATTQEEQMHLALCLRRLGGDHWTTEQKEKYFEWFLASAEFRGGNSFSGFLKNIRDEAVEGLSEADKAALAAVLAKTPEPIEPTIAATHRPLVREYKVDDLLPFLSEGLTGRDFENGRDMFALAGCFKCHRFAGQGGIVGPDLTAVGRRFNARNLLESVIEPDKVISDQYEATSFVLTSGKQVTGRIVNLNQNRLMVSENMLEPGRLTVVKREEIEESVRSTVSMMPAGLLNNLTQDEILDLMAYLISGGNPKAPQFDQKLAADVPPAAFLPSGHVADSLDMVRGLLLSGQAVLLDVREISEWEEGHLRDACLVPLSVARDGAFTKEMREHMPQDRPIYVHCKSGGRVLLFAQLMRKQGFDIRPLRAGFDMLVQAGFPTAE